MTMSKSTPFAGRRQAGLTLVELMIGIALSLVVILAVVSVFSGSRASYRHQESFSAVQETGRIALEVLTRDLRMAGHPGCGNLLFMEHLSSLDALPVDARFSNEFALTGDGNQVSIVRGSAQTANLVSSPANNQVQVDNLAALGAVAVGDRLLISDCAYTEVLNVSAVVGNTVTADANLFRQYRPGSRVMRLEQVNFARSPQGELLRNGQPIAGGVQVLRFMYGIPGAGTRSVVEYTDSPTADQLQSAVALRVSMTVADAAVQNIPFNSTITLRNRAP